MRIGRRDQSPYFHQIGLPAGLLAAYLRLWLHPLSFPCRLTIESASRVHSRDSNLSIHSCARESHNPCSTPKTELQSGCLPVSSVEEDLECQGNHLETLRFRISVRRVEREKPVPLRMSPRPEPLSRPAGARLELQTGRRCLSCLQNEVRHSDDRRPLSSSMSPQQPS